VSFAHKGIGYISVLLFQPTKACSWIPLVVLTCHWYNINSLRDVDLSRVVAGVNAISSIFLRLH